MAATAIDAGLPKSSIFASLDWVAAGNLTAVPGITSQIAASVTNVYLLTYSDSFKYVYLASIAFGCVGIVAACFVPNSENKFYEAISRRMHGIGLGTTESKVYEEKAVADQ